MHSATYRWHVALTSAGGVYATLGGLAAALGLVMLLSDFELPLTDALVLIVGLAVLALGVLEIVAGWLFERALPADAPKKRPYMWATREAFRGLLLGVALPPLVGTLVLPTLYAYNTVKRHSERKAEA